MRVITDYAYALALLDRYDHGTLAIEETTGEIRHIVTYEESMVRAAFQAAGCRGK